MARKVPKDNHPGDYGTATAATNAATCHFVSGLITSEALTTAAGSTYTLTLTNMHCFTNSVVLASVGLGSSTNGLPTIVSITNGATDGTVVIIVKNIDGSNAFNGTIAIAFHVVT